MERCTLIFLMMIGLIFNSVLAQSGYNKILKSNEVVNLNIDGINFFNNRIYLGGNARITSPGLIGSWTAALDTLGNIIWEYVLLDSTEHIIMNTPNNLMVVDEFIYNPLNYFYNNRLGVIKLDQFGNKVDIFDFLSDDVFIQPYDITKYEDYLYMFGYVNENNNGRGAFALRIDLNGNQIWKKRFVSPSGNSGFADVVDHGDGRFTISSAEVSDDFLKDSKVQGWIKPWIFTIDTNGTILESWLGEENDERTFGFGPLLHMENGDWIIGSTEYVEQWHLGDYWLRRIPTISRLDPEFNLIWKKDFNIWPGHTDKWLDFDYDSLRDEIIIAGERGLLYDSVYGELCMWILKLKPDGTIIWEVADTIISGIQNDVIHFTAGLALAPSGSIYVTGYMDHFTNPPYQSGWLVKATPDGCIETLCTTTSLEEQIAAKAGIQILFPNPVHNEIRIRLPDPPLHGSALWIYNTQGMPVRNEAINQQTYTFTTDLAPGMYVYELREGMTTRYIGKFVKL